MSSLSNNTESGINGDPPNNAFLTKTGLTDYDPDQDFLNIITVGTQQFSA
jgi:hypothetical protein